MPHLEIKRINRDLLLIAAFSIAAMLPAIYYGVPTSNDQA